MVPSKRLSASALSILQAASIIVVAFSCACSGARSGPTTVALPVPPDITPGAVVEGVAHLAVGENDHRACVVLRGGTVHCSAKPLGGGEPTMLALAQVGGFEALRVAQIENGLGSRTGRHCAILDDQTVRCFRYANDVEDMKLSGALEVAMGGDFGCARRADGSIWCWGSNLNWAAGDMSQTRPGEIPPKPVLGVSDAVDIATDVHGACAARKDGSVICWGAHPFNSGQMFSKELAAPAPVAWLPAAKRIAIGGRRACVLTTKKTVDCFDGSEQSIALSGKTLNSNEIVDPVDVVIAGGTAYVLLASGVVYRWGPGPLPYQITPEIVERERAEKTALLRMDAFNDAVQVAAMRSHVCVRTRAAQVRCVSVDWSKLGDAAVAASKVAHPLKWYQRDMVPEPQSGVRGCTTTPTDRRACAQAGDQCLLEPPPGYWYVPAKGGILLDDNQVKRYEDKELEGRSVPACMCSCSGEFKKAQQEFLDAVQREPRYR